MANLCIQRDSLKLPCAIFADFLYSRKTVCGFLVKIKHRLIPGRSPQPLDDFPDRNQLGEAAASAKISRCLPTYVSSPNPTTYPLPLIGYKLDWIPISRVPATISRRVASVYYVIAFRHPPNARFSDTSQSRVGR